MRALIPSLVCLAVSACAHAPASTPEPSAAASSQAAPSVEATDLPHMEPPASPMPGWQQVRKANDMLRSGTQRAEALALYEEALAAGNESPYAAYSAACAAALLGQKADALRLLSKAVDWGYRDVAWMKQDTDLVSLREDPAFLALVERMPTLPERYPRAHAELKRLFEEDQADRQGPLDGPDAWKKVAERDAQRRQRVKALMAEGALKEGADFLAAGFIFQHGNTQADYAMARQMGAEAAKRGHPMGLWLTAAAWDRWLMNANRPQRFGTQYQFDKEAKKMTLHPVDPSVTDEERARWGFPPLAEIPKVLEQ
ncbi:TPR end-of-group domain-containing protein [Myxococcus sp. Y35]|uniref:TPR end-of-group domain-containing protein n=1 Tax=Pseudomyxococcus flavus TaxID=3115648 RepID=UPI003CEA3BE9